MKNYTEAEAKIIAEGLTTKAINDGKSYDAEYAYPYAVGALQSMIASILMGNHSYCKQFLSEAEKSKTQNS